MSVEFSGCALSPLEPLSAAAPSGAVIGVIGDEGAGKQELLRLATGTVYPQSGQVRATPPCRYHGPFDPLEIGDARTLALYHTLALKDAAARADAALRLERFRRAGGTAFLVSHELDLINWLSDEVWWLDRGRLRAKGDPRETTDAYRRHIASSLYEAGRRTNIALTPTMRKGDGRASLVAVESLGPDGEPSSVWRSSQPAGVRVVVRFHAPVADPVVGILVRTRIGFEVYGTNTELEKVRLGPCAAGDTLEILFRFLCHLCPQEYTLTVASHDPDGVWHDWMEDGLALRVVDDRYTAGVACMRAQVEFRKLS